MKTRTNGIFHIFKTKKVEIGLNETPKKTIHVYPKKQRMKIRISTNWVTKDDIIIENARSLVIENIHEKKEKSN